MRQSFNLYIPKLPANGETEHGEIVILQIPRDGKSKYKIVKKFDILIKDVKK